MGKATIKIGGMSCQHCVASVARAVTGLQGVLKTDISIGSATIDYDESKVKREQIEAAIEKAGYTVEKEG